MRYATICPANLSRCVVAKRQPHAIVAIVECLIARYLLGIRDPVSKQRNAMMPAEPRYATSPATLELRHTLPWLVGPLRREDTCKSPGTILQVPNLVKDKQLICIASRPNSFLPSNLLDGHVFNPPRSFAIRAAATTARARIRLRFPDIEL